MVRLWRRPATWLVVAAAALAPALWRASGQATFTLVRWPYVQNMRTDRASILWATREEGFGVVEYSSDRSYSRRAVATGRLIPSSITGSGQPYYQYQADLTGLTPNSEYFYRVLVDDEVLTFEELRCRTAGTGPNFQFLAFGDSGEGSPAQRGVARLMSQENPALVLHTGDIAYPVGSFDQFQRRHFDIYQTLMQRLSFFPSPGNHDYDTQNALPYVTLHSLPTEEVPPPDHNRYYSFDWGEVHFVAIDTNRPLQQAVQANGPMLRWLDEDLRRTRKLWRVAYFHHPAYPTSNHENDSTSVNLVRPHLLPILERHEVQLVLSGHEHNYQQSVPMRGGRRVEPGLGTVHVITGAGGAPLYPAIPRDVVAYAESAHHYVRGEVEAQRITLRAIRVDGQEIDTVRLTTLPILAAEAAVNAASFTTSLAPGALISIFGRRLALEEASATSLPLPNELAGTIVRINGRRLPLLYVSRNQINAQVLFDVMGPATLRVEYPGGFAEVPVTISEPAPAIFSTTPELGQRPAAIHLNGQLVTPNNPVQAGETISIFLTGLGRPSAGEITAGQPAPAQPLLSISGPVVATFGAVNATPSFAGLAPGFAGLYQVNVQVPLSLATSTYPLRIVARGISSNTVNLAVRGR